MEFQLYKNSISDNLLLKLENASVLLPYLHPAPVNRI